VGIGGDVLGRYLPRLVPRQGPCMHVCVCVLCVCCMSTHRPRTNERKPPKRKAQGVSRRRKGTTQDGRSLFLLDDGIKTVFFGGGLSKKATSLAARLSVRTEKGTNPKSDRICWE
jgi:hypothetical protein